MMKTSKKAFFIFVLFFCTRALCMVCDNRYFPFFPIPHTRIEDKRSWFSIAPFFTTADCAYDEHENEMPIPFLYDKYDQKKLGFALQKVGLPNAFPAPFLAADAIWEIDQKIHGRGVGFSFEKYLFSPLSIGFSWLFMHVNSRHHFCLTDCRGLQLPGHIEELKDARLEMHKALGICEAYSSRGGMGDFDCYFRIGDIWDYPFRLRRIDAGLTLGMIFPSGKKRDVYSPTTVPFGGNGHWGAYARAEGEFELREDLKTYFSVHFGKRFEKCYDMRLPVAGEHPAFGALVTPVSVDPGLFFMFTAYGSIENLREGLGLRLGLRFSLQEHPEWSDLRSRTEKEDLPVVFSKDCTIDNQFNNDFCRLADLDGWRSDYLFVNVFYDFGKTAPERGYKPIVTFSWDIPYRFFVSEQNIKTHRISLGIEVNF